jgi:Spy/CpxP family protein refolding chaperone
MHRWLTLLALLGSAGLLAVPAYAQSERAPGGRGTGSRQIIQNESVHKELKLSAEQIRKLKTIPEEVRELLKADFAEMVALEGDERRTKSKYVRKRYTEEYLKAMAHVLTPEQMKRLNQISLQHSGVQMFAEPDVEKALSLTDKQKTELKTIMQEAQRATFEIIQKLDDKEAAADKVAAMNKDSIKKAAGLLTSTQQEALKDLLGAPFEVKVDKVMIVGSEGTERRYGQKTVSGPGADKNDLSWVAKRVEEWQPTKEEHLMDQIGWAADIREAIRVGKANGRPVFLFNYSGRIGAGRC